ncbi:hypothetical protein ACG2OD_14690 [Streptomyces sp. PDY-4]|uniref:hypothetical protein n=1 Tax=Streptomyces sp. PDY-4 TaxID=3376070 RepID=UPI00379594E9
MKAEMIARFGLSTITHAIRGEFRYDRSDNRTVCGRTGGFAVETMQSGKELDVTCAACEVGEYRWIVYMYQPGPGGMFGEITRAQNLRDALGALETYEREVYADGCTASLYAYSPEDWITAEDYRDVGNPFDYPSKVIERGPKGGMRIVNA